MKKITLLAAAFAITSIGMAQSQRTVLAEEFTQASCGPCAAQNPAFNALLTTNLAKVVSLKYQTSWPGVDPMNAQNPADVATRVTYYGVSGVPDSPMDGVEQTGGSYTGAPANYTQAAIDAEYAVTSPFTIAMSHTFSADYDSIFVTCVITASQAYTAAGTLKAHIAMAEETISFASAPGSNGETAFYNIMRKMYPTAAGTTLAGTWTSGQTQTISFGAPIPSYIYKKSEIYMVGFIQSDGDKKVQQAGRDAKQALASDIGATTITGVPTFQCTATFTPTVTVKNFGTTTLTSCTLNYKVDAGAVSTQAWTGSLASGASTTATLPLVTAAVGGHTFTSYTSAPNGGLDFDAANDQKVVPFAIVSATGSASPLVEGFTAATYPPAGWFIGNADNGLTWTRKTGAGGFGTSTACSKIDFYTIASGNIDELYSKNVDFSGSTTASMTFNVAYAQYSTENDRIEVKASSDCGTTWTTVYNKSGTTLSTATATTAAFTPTAAQWRAEVVNLNAFAGQPSVIVKFVATSAYGNNAYVDDINLLNGSVGITEASLANNVTVYPNPISNTATVNFNLVESNEVSIEVVNALGQLVSTTNLGTLATGDQTYSLDASSLNNGLYFINIHVGNSISFKKVSVIK